MKKILVLIAMACIVIACSKTTARNGDTQLDCSGPAKSFATDVEPVIRSTCAGNGGCHSAGSNNGPGQLTRYSEVFNAKSAIREAILSGRMPLGGSLTNAQRNAIICWIDNGAAEN